MKHQPVTPNIYQLTRLGFFNSFLVREEEGFTLVDTTLRGNSADVLAVARQLGASIRRVLLTHAHGDHIGALDEIAAALPALDTDNMGSLNAALAQKYPKDRFGYMLYQADEIFSGFSYYDFYPYIQQETDPEIQQQMINALWRQDIAQWTPTLASQPNVSYWIPFYRDFNGSHCLTIVDFSGTGIEDQGYADMMPFINENLQRGPIQRRQEVDQVSDLSRPVSLALQILTIVLDLFGGA